MTISEVRFDANGIDRIMNYGNQNTLDTQTKIKMQQHRMFRLKFKRFALIPFDTPFSHKILCPNVRTNQLITSHCKRVLGSSGCGEIAKQFQC